MILKLWLAAALAVLPAIACGGTPPPFSTVQAWWRAKHTEPVDEYGSELDPEEIDSSGEPIEIHLMNRETAYLYPVFISHRGRNDFIHTIMARPDLKEVREVADPVRRDLKVFDFDNDGISEVVCMALGSGEGSTVGVKAIVQFDGWTPIVLHKADFEDNEGAYGTRTERYFSRSVSWQFTDSDNDGNADLVEEITIKQGRKNRSPITAVVKNKFVIRNGHLLRNGGVPKGASFN